MIPLIVKSLLFVSATMCYAVQVIHFTHMLQLNSYRDERYMRWCNENSNRLVSINRLLPLLVAVLAFIQLENTWRNGIAVVILLLTTLCNLQKRQRNLWWLPHV